MKRVTFLFIVAVCLGSLAGCNYSEFEDEIKGNIEEKKIENQSTPEIQIENGEVADSVVIKTGPFESAFNEKGKVNFTIDNVQYYESIGDAGVETDDFHIIENRGYWEDFGFSFLLMDLSIENISNVGVSDESEIPWISMGSLAVYGRKDAEFEKDKYGLGWKGSPVCYIENNVKEEKYLNCVSVAKGETIETRIGFFVPTGNKEAVNNLVLCWIGGGRYYELPPLSE